MEAAAVHGEAGDLLRTETAAAVPFPFVLGLVGTIGEPRPPLVRHASRRS